jgi:hypothetical protein
MVLQIWLECLIAAHDIQQPRPNTPSCSVASASTYSCSIHITLVGGSKGCQSVRIPTSQITLYRPAPAFHCTMSDEKLRHSLEGAKKELNYSCY